MPILVLLAAHLPFLSLYYIQLWGQEHYRFFPFALFAWGWMFLRRRHWESVRWLWLPAGFLVMDLVSLCVALRLGSPWFAALGFMMVLTALGLATREHGHRQKLMLLTLLPLLTLRPPVDYGEQLVQWLQRITTSAASGMLHRLGFLHYRDGNTIHTTQKSFLVAEACSGVNSVYTTLFLAALIICLKRRAVMHAVALLITGFAAAAGMNICRILMITMAWEAGKYDLSTGTSHTVVGYVCLLLSGAFLYSADAFFEFLTSPVPNVARPGAIFRNPFISLWNRWVTVVPLTEAEVVTNPVVPSRTWMVLSVLTGLAMLTLQAWQMVRGRL